MCYLLDCSVQVMVWWLLLLPLSTAILCRPGHQFWDETLEKCINCSKCPEVGHVVLRPCQVHQDTHCGPVSALDIDWSFLGRPRSTKATSSLHSQHLSEKHSRGNKHHELFLEDHLHVNKHNADSRDRRLSHYHPQSDEELSQDVRTPRKHRNRSSHPKIVSSEEKEIRIHKKSHHRKLSSEESYSSNRDETPNKHHKHHHYHKKHTSSETHSLNPRKLQPQNHNKTKSHHHHHKFKWTSSEIVRSFDSPDSSNSSELHPEDGHRWSFSERTSSVQHHTTSFRKSNSTKKHSHHHSHHSHSHNKQTNTSETHKHHGKKQKLQSLQEKVAKMSVQLPESASQLKESEASINSSFAGDVKNDIEGQSVQIGQSIEPPKHLHKINSPSSVSSAPFSATEKLIWDWQAVALALAVFACLLFFVVACVYSVHHARQWRRLKDHFEDFEAG